MFFIQHISSLSCVLSLAKEIDFWQRKSTALASQLADSDKSYNSKLENVLAEQENLSGQQQQVLKDLSTALAAHKEALALAAAAQTSPKSAQHSHSHAQLPFSPEVVS